MQQQTTAWNEIFRQHGKVFTDPHEDVPDLVQLLRDKGATRILDLGSGSGRHVVYLARNGLAVFALDNSSEGVSITRHWLAREGLSADVRLQDMTQPLPYEDDFFDAVVSVQVMHHADVKTIHGIIAEIERVLKTGGLIFATVPRTRHFEAFQEIEPNTLVPLDGPEKGLPHHYFTPEELREFFRGFDVLDIHLDQADHYCLSALKQGDSRQLGVCGLYCGACYHYRASFPEGQHLLEEALRRGRPLEGFACQGCRSGTLYVHPGCAQCQIRACAEGKRIIHCGACPDFPCDRITAFQSDGRVHHRDTLSNLADLQACGAAQWLAAQGQRWQCACGMPFSWYEESCSHCGAPLASYGRDPTVG